MEPRTGRPRALALTFAATALSAWLAGGLAVLPGPAHAVVGASVDPAVEAAWDTLAGPIDPTPSYSPVTFHDAVRHRMVVLDGLDPASIWWLSLTPRGTTPPWHLFRVAGPAPYRRDDFVAVCDSVRDRVLVFGGGWDFAYNDVWALSFGDTPRWTQLAPAGDPPPAGSGYRGVLDPVHDRLIVLNGAMQLWALELSTTPTWHPLAAEGTAPPPRGGASVVYDSWHHRMVMFGGYGDVPNQPCHGNHYNDTWALDLDVVPRWHEILAASPPGPRVNGCVVYVPERRSMYLQGGGRDFCSGGDPAWNDAWVLRLDGLPIWRQLAPPASERQVGARGFIDCPERRSAIRYGGGWNSCFELPLETSAWAALEPPAPDPYPVRRPAALVVPDMTGSGFLAFGGYFRHDLWRFTRSTSAPWTPLPSVGVAAGPGAPNLVYDPRRDRLLGFGATVSPVEQYRHFDVNAMPLGGGRAWAPIVAQGPMPPANLFYSVVYDPRRDRVLLFGGADYPSLAYDCGQSQDDLWELSLGEPPRWTPLHTMNSPGPRDGHHAFYDPHGDRMIVFGGDLETTGIYCSGGMPLRDTWALSMGGDSLGWTRLDARAPLDDGSVVLDTLRDRLVVLAPDMTAWALSLADSSGWHALSTAGAGPARHDFPGVAFDPVHDEMIVFGGWNDADVHALRFLTPLTREISLALVGNGGAASDRPRTLGAAVLGAPGFAVDSVVASSIRLAGAPAIGHPAAARRDVNGDGVADLVFEVERAAVQSAASDTALAFVAEASHGTQLVGSLDVRPGGPGLRGGLRPDLAEAGASPAAPVLRVVGPARAGEALALAYVLPATVRADTRATLSVYDVAGRRVVARELDRGAHAGALSLEEMRGRPPGVYFVRLVQGAWSARGRAVVLP